MKPIKPICWTVWVGDDGNSRPITFDDLDFVEGVSGDDDLIPLKKRTAVTVARKIQESYANAGLPVPHMRVVPKFGDRSRVDRETIVIKPHI